MTSERERIIGVLARYYGRTIPEAVNALLRSGPAGDDNHCKDCCCARSWAALGITAYTGRSIPEHIEELREENRRLRALAEPVGEPWRSIETAPRHVTEILVFSAEWSDDAVIAKWRRGKGAWYDRAFDWDSTRYGEISPQPTHWMPLPTPPAAPEAQEPEHKDEDEAWADLAANARKSWTAENPYGTGNDDPVSAASEEERPNVEADIVIPGLGLVMRKSSAAGEEERDG